MVEALERATPFNEGSSYFVGDWLIQPEIDDVTVAAGATEEVDLDEFANVAFIYLVEIGTDSTDYEFKLWNSSARGGSPVLHLVKDSDLVGYRRLILYVDEDRSAELHFDIKNNDGVSRTFAVSLKAVRQI